MDKSVGRNYNNFVATLHRQTDRQTDQGVVNKGTGCASEPVTTTGMLSLLQRLERIGGGELRKENLATRTIQYTVHSTSMTEKKFK